VDLDAISDIARHGAVARGTQSCVIVCGLHRSGTSAVTRLINLLGADVADDLLPATVDNSRGYWESRIVIAIHKRLLKSVAAGSHDDPFDPAPLPPGWLATDAAREAKRRLAGVINEDFSDSRLFVVKDPRIARLLPLWIELLEDLGIAPMVVIPFRNPLEVAASLAHREQISLPKSLLLYLFAYLELELASRNLPRVFVRYDQLLRDWRPVARRFSQVSGGGVLPPSEGVALEIERFLTTELYHHRSSREHLVRQLETAPEIVEIFDGMNDAAETGDENALRVTFDRIRATAESVARLYQGFVSSELKELRLEARRTREAFEASTSWRITAPLRWLKRRIV
jgi:hypothetical protein